MANFFKGNEPLVITNTNINKSSKGSKKKSNSVSFMSQKIMVYLSTLLIALSLFIPFVKVTTNGVPESYTLFEMDNVTAYFFISVIVFSLVALLFNSKIALALAFIDGVYSLFKFMLVCTSVEYNIADNKLLTGFYVFSIGIFFLIFGILWQFVSKNEQFY